MRWSCKLLFYQILFFIPSLACAQPPPQFTSWLKTNQNVNVTKKCFFFSFLNLHMCVCVFGRKEFTSIFDVWRDFWLGYLKKSGSAGDMMLAPSNFSAFFLILLLLAVPIHFPFTPVTCEDCLHHCVPFFRPSFKLRKRVITSECCSDGFCWDDRHNHQTKAHTELQLGHQHPASPRIDVLSSGSKKIGWFSFSSCHLT